MRLHLHVCAVYCMQWHLFYAISWVPTAEHCYFAILQVANVVGRAESLSCIFFLLSVLSYTHSIGGLRQSPFPPVSNVRWSFILLVVLFAACAMLSKEQGIMALGVCATLDVLVHWETVILG